MFVSAINRPKRSSGSARLNHCDNPFIGALAMAVGTLPHISALLKVPMPRDRPPAHIQPISSDQRQSTGAQGPAFSAG